MTNGENGALETVANQLGDLSVKVGKLVEQMAESVRETRELRKDNEEMRNLRRADIWKGIAMVVVMVLLIAATAVAGLVGWTAYQADRTEATAQRIERCRDGNELRSSTVDGIRRAIEEAGAELAPVEDQAEIVAAAERIADRVDDQPGLRQRVCQ